MVDSQAGGPCHRGQQPMSEPDGNQLDLQAIGAFFAERGVAVDGPLSARLIAGGRSNLTVVVSDARRRWGVRCPPGGGRTLSSHDVAREFRVTRALVETGVPVARTIALC